jgi:tetratricopeptide (TPR) repeat protein
MTMTAQTWGVLFHARGKKSSSANGDSREGGRRARGEQRRPAREGAGAPTQTAGFERGDWLAILLLAAACVLVYGNTVGNQFVWDDRKQILENDLIKDPRLFGRAMVSDVWAFKGDTGEPWSNYWRPVFVLWLIGNYRAFGLESTAGWHITNIVLHALVVALAYVFLRRLGLSLLLTLAVMLPFTVHPIHVESVSWISGSPDMLVASGLLAALILLLGRAGDEPPTTGATTTRYFTLVLSLIAFGISLLSKEITIFFPAIIFVTLFLTGPRVPTLGARAWGAAKRTIPFVVVTGIYAATHYKILGKTQIAVPWNAGLTGVVMTAPRVLFYYLREAFLPLWIAPAYPVRLVRVPDAANFVVPALVVAPFLLGLVWLARRDAVRGIGLAIFLVPLLPALNINAFAPDRIVADRYLYLPALGLLMILVPSFAELVAFLRGQRAGAGGAESPARSPAEAGGARPDLVTFWVFAAGAVLLGLQTIRYNRTWESELTLWTAAVAADPNSVSALNEYGLLLFEAKNYAEARKVLDRALSIEPLTTAYLLRADVATAEKRYADAEADVKKVLSVYRDNAGAYERLALVYQSERRFTEAESTLRTAIVEAPHRRGTFTDSLGVILYLQGRREEALKVLEDGRALASTDLDPGAHGITFHLGMLYLEMGRAREARVTLEEYMRMSVRSVEPSSRAMRKQAAAALEKLPQ